MIRVLRTILAVVCILVIAVCASLIVRKVAGGARADLTEHKLYTLSDGTRNILGKLNQTVKLKLYYARTATMKGPEWIRFYNTYYLYVRSLLEEYVKVSGGRVTLEVIDPRRYSEDEQSAVENGILPFPLENDETFFFGLAAQTELGKVKAIGLFVRERQELVEYDVSQLIANIVQREKKKVGILSSLPVTGAEMSPYMLRMMQMQGRRPPPPWQIVQDLGQAYEITPVKSDADEIETDLDLLMVVHPKSLPEKTLFAIDQFVMRGGKLLVFVDPHCISDTPPAGNPSAQMLHKTGSDLNRLLRGWGVEMDETAIAADRALALEIPQRTGVVHLSTYMVLNKDCVNSDEIVTAQLHDVRVLFPGVLKKVEGASTTVTELLTTTPGGGTWKPRAPRELLMPDFEAINRAVKPAGADLMLACRISGKMKTNFPDGIQTPDKPAEEPEDKDKDDKEEKKEEAPQPKPEVLAEAAPEAAVFVVADVDVISNFIAYNPSMQPAMPVGHNRALLFNIIEFLRGSQDLIAVCSRGRFKRPFDRFDEIEAEAEKAVTEKLTEVRARVTRFRKELDALGSGATAENIRFIQSEVVAKRRQLGQDLLKAQNEERKLNEEKRNKIERLQFWLKVHNVVWAPAAVLLIAIALAVVRAIRARYYAARRT